MLDINDSQIEPLIAVIKEDHEWIYDRIVELWGTSNCKDFVTRVVMDFNERYKVTEESQIALIKLHKILKASTTS